MNRSKFAPFYKRSCDDCLLLGLCGNPKARRFTGYCCKMWEYRYE